MKQRAEISAVYIMFLASGMTGLAYEVIWTRLLVRVFGATSFAVTTVLASYMGGLALGSYLFGRAIDRRGKPLKVYGILQLGIGVFAVVFPFLLSGLNRVYQGLYPALEGRFYLSTIVRFGFCFGMLLVPATLMGGTLPVLSKYVTRSVSHLTERVGRLYAINTLGAVGGAFGTGFVLLPRLGISHTTWLCAAINLVIFGVAYALSMRPREEAVPEGDSVALRASAGRKGFRWGSLVLVAFLLTGFCALSAEVIWTRVLSLVIGTTVYAFSAMLTTFLFGLALGSWVLARLAQRTRHPGTVFGLVVAGVGFAVLASSVGFGKLPLIYMSYYERFDPGWASLVWIQFLLCFLIMFVPTFLMGGTFPLVARLYARDARCVGGEIGTVYAFNTIGSILGSVAGSLLLLRYLGVENSLMAISILYVGVGVLLLTTVADFSRRVVRISVVGAVLGVSVILLIVSPGWDRKMMTTGVYRYVGVYGTVEELRGHVRAKTILFYDEGPGATVAVTRIHDQISLLIDGKADASTGAGDMTTQVLLAHLPLLLHPDPSDVLVIGLGSGVSLGSAERYPVGSIDCVELLENVVEAATYFDPYNYRCLSDARANLIIGDGRNHALLADRQYDVIISEPTNPWISGVGDLFTLEFFKMARQRLRPDGIMSAWFHTYHMGDEDLRATIKAFAAAFPHITLWMANESDIIFLGSSEPFSYDQRLIHRAGDDSVASDLRRVWINGPADILSCYITGTRGLRLYGEAARHMHTDDNMMLEFSAAKKTLELTERIHLSNFLDILELPPLEGIDRTTAEQVRTQTEARTVALRGTLAKVGGRPEEALRLYDLAFERAPSDPFVLSAYVNNHISAGDALLDEGDYVGAADHYRKASVITGYPESGRAYHGLGMCDWSVGQYQSAYENFELSVRVDPYSVAGHYSIGRLELALGRPDAAIAAFETVLELAPEHAGAADNLARLYTQRGEKLSRARELAEMASSIMKEAAYYNTLGWIYHRLGLLDQARKVLRNSLRSEPGNSEALLRLAAVELVRANTEEARKLLTELVGKGRDDQYTREARAMLREIQTKK